MSLLQFCFALLILQNLVCAEALSPGQPGAKSDSIVGSNYIEALATADHLLQAWQSGDVETGLALLTEHAKQGMSRDDLDHLFANAPLKAYEIERGKLLKPGRYEFAVALTGRGGGRSGVRRHFGTIVVVNTGNSDWAVDKLPR